CALTGGITFDPGVPLEPPDRKEYRLAFFFHYLDLAKLLEPSFGPLALPQPSLRPERLALIERQNCSKRPCPSRNRDPVGRPVVGGPGRRIGPGAAIGSIGMAVSGWSMPFAMNIPGTVYS